MFRWGFPIWKLQSKDFLLSPYARAVQKRMETASENHGNLSVILLLVLSVGDIPQRHGLQADKPADERGAAETGRGYRTGTVYVKAGHLHPLRFTRRQGEKPDRNG